MEENYGFKPNFLPNAPPEQNHFPCNYPDPSLSYSNSYQPAQNVAPFTVIIPPTSINDFDNVQNKAYKWVDTHAYGGVPSTALKGGVDVDGHQIYVGRAFFNGDWIPAKVIPGKNVAYIAYGGVEHIVDVFQVLCETRFEWIHSSGSNLPHGAVQGGKTSDGEPLYVGRVYHEGSQTIGKVQLSHGSCYIPFDGKEIPYTDYEILVLIS